MNPEAVNTEVVNTLENPLLTVVRGNPTAEEIAAIVMVIGAAGTAAAPDDPRPPEIWGLPTGLHRDGSPFAPRSFAAAAIARPGR